jgi:hypothetical protein
MKAVGEGELSDAPLGLRTLYVVMSIHFAFSARYAPLGKNSHSDGF